MAEQLANLRVRIGADISDFRSKMSQVRDTISGIHAALAGLASGIAGLTVLKGIKINADIEQAHIAFETLLKDGEKADQMIKDLRKLGAESPFEFEGLEKSAKLLLAMGVDAKKILPWMRKIGDAVAAVGGGQTELENVARALAQINAKGKVSAEEMNQLAENGIPAWQILSEKMGKSVGELMKMGEQGKLLAKDVLPVLIDGMGNKFAGAMEKQSKTFSGMMSTIKDNANIILGDLFKPLFDSIKKYLPKVVELSNQFARDLENGGLARAIRNLIPSNLRTKLDLFRGWLNALKFELDKQDWDGVGALIGLKLREGIQKIKGLGAQLAHKIATEINNTDWGKVAEDVRKGIGDFAIGIVRMFNEDLANAMKNGDWKSVGEQLGNITIRGIESLGKKAEQIGRAIEKAFKGVDWYNVGVRIGKVAAPMILGFLEGLLDADTLASVIQDHWEGILMTAFGFAALPERVSLKIAQVLEKIPIVGKILSWLTKKANELGGPLRKWAKERFQVLFDGIGKSIEEGFKNSFKGESIKETLMKPFRQAWKDLGDWFDTKVLQFNQKLTQWGNKLGNIMGQAGAQMRQKINAEINRIYAKFDEFKKWAAKIVQDIMNKFKSMKISIPKFKLPHIKVSMSSKNIAGVNIPFPTFSVEWYAKGGIFNAPSVIGVGEAGPEAVVPLSGSRMRPFAKAIASEMGGGGNTYNFYVNNNGYPMDERTMLRLWREAELLHG